MKTRALSILVAVMLLLCGCAPQTAGTSERVDNTRAAAEEEPLGYTQITQDEAKERMQREDGHVIVDVRTREEYDAGHIPGAILIPNESIGCDSPEALPDYDQILLIYCRSGRRSKEAAQKLAEMGYRNVYEFGGIIDWTGEIVAEATYEFDPHLYVPLLASDIPQDYWDAFHNLCDALRAGGSTFTCASEDAYDWAMNPSTLNTLFPAACTKITAQSDDGSLPYENGVGRIYYQMPVEEYVERQAAFEAMIEDILNANLGADDNAFEKALKIFDYMSANYTYQYDFVEDKMDGANYVTLMMHEGQCIDLAGVYSYLLLQAGVEAFQVGCSNESIAHDWVYLVIDGAGYYSDVTWSLRPTGEEELPLCYFLMNGARREESGCSLDELTSPLLPNYWFSRSNSVVSADNDRLVFPYEAYLSSLDEANKIVHYTIYNNEYEVSYVQN